MRPTPTPHRIPDGMQGPARERDRAEAEHGPLQVHQGQDDGLVHNHNWAVSQQAAPRQP